MIPYTSTTANQREGLCKLVSYYLGLRNSRVEILLRRRGEDYTITATKDSLRRVEEDLKLVQKSVIKRTLLTIVDEYEIILDKNEVEYTVAELKELLLEFLGKVKEEIEKVLE